MEPYFRRGVSAPTVNDIVRERRGITPEMSARLARYFGTTKQFWLNLQDAFRRSSGQKEIFARTEGDQADCWRSITMI